MSTVKVVPHPYRELLLQAKRERAIVESGKARALQEEVFTVQRYSELLEKQKMSGDGKRSVAAWPKLPRPSSTLPKWECVSSLCGVSKELRTRYRQEEWRMVSYGAENDPQPESASDPRGGYLTSG